MKVSIIILNWNGGSVDCIESVQSALSQNYENKEIIFVDNGSTDNSCQTVKKKFPDLRFIELKKNIGCPPGRNVGAQNATGDLIFFLENDGVWKNHTVVSSAVEIFRKYKKLGALYTMVEGYNTSEPDKPLDPFPSKNTITGLYLSSSFRGGASIIRRDVFLTNNGFPDDFFRQLEERFLSLLIYNAGYKVAYWPIHSMRHKGSDYVGKTATVLKYSVENNLKTVIRLYPLIPALIVGFSKWLVGNIALLKTGMLKEAISINVNILKEVLGKKHYQRISLKVFCEVETLRQGYANNAYIDSGCDAEPIAVLLFRRLFNSKIHINE